MLKNKIKLILGIVLIMGIYSCDNEKCPEGSIPITDVNGDVIDCTEVPKFR